MNDTFERLKPFLLDYVNEITQPSKNSSKNQYICPLYGSGTGSHHSGAFTFYPNTNTYYCFACNAMGDIGNLYDEMNHISDFTTILRELQVKYGIITSSSQPISQKKQPITATPIRQEIDYSTFLNNAETHIHETDYFTKRGLSLNTQRKFHCGYINSYSYDHNTKMTPAVIIRLQILLICGEVPLRTSNKSVEQFIFLIILH